MIIYTNTDIIYIYIYIYIYIHTHTFKYIYIYIYITVSSKLSFLLWQSVLRSSARAGARPAPASTRKQSSQHSVASSKGAPRGLGV